jgi:hypothetical protein
MWWNLFRACGLVVFRRTAEAMLVMRLSNCRMIQKSLQMRQETRIDDKETNCKVPD